ncbi:MAG: hypothetical protein HY321_22385 [Armatimonadetes bacterium]|nr:hypothetical protein [Armatimonadota bacterium]
MPRYRCREERLPTGERVVRLEDTAAGVDAAVIPERGADWSAFGMHDASGRRIELLHPAVDFDGPGSSPVLFPIVGRSWCDGQLGAYRHRGRVRPMPIHGFARSTAWEVAARGTDGASARVTCRLADSESTRALYPYPFRLTLTYRVRAGALAIEAAVENPGDEPLPFHLGYHPYFRAPVLPGGDRRRCLLGVPSRAAWELENGGTTGGQVPLPDDLAYDPPRPLADAGLDRVFASLRPDPATGLAACRLLDPDCGCGAEVRFDVADFPVFVVYSPSHQPFACLEPWTGLPGGLGDDVLAGRQARRVAPGGRFTATVTAHPLVP